MVNDSRFKIGTTCRNIFSNDFVCHIDVDGEESQIAVKAGTLHEAIILAEYVITALGKAGNNNSSSPTNCLTSDTEQQLFKCWNILEDIEDVYMSESIIEDQDKLANVLIGIHVLYQEKFEKLYAMLDNERIV